MPKYSIVVSEATGSGGVATGTGSAFVAAPFDAGPPTNSPKYVLCQSMSDVIESFGPRSSASATGYDWLDWFFHDSNAAGAAYVTNVTDASATSAALTLQDGLASSKPTVVVTAATPGTEGNLTFVTVVAAAGDTFTANTSSSGSPTVLAAVSSFKNIGPGTPVTGAGIPANTYLTAVNPGASTATMNNSATATASGVTITPGNVTINIVVEDASGNEIADETHGPYYLTSQLFADASSDWVTFAQSSGSGFTVNLPAALASTAMAGGADAGDLTDANHVAALANFPPGLGGGTVALPGKTGIAIWSGLLQHAATTNRFAALDMADAATSGSAISAKQALQASANNTYGMFIQGSAILPPIVSGANRIAPGSAGVAALFARVAQTNNQNQTPSGPDWPLSYPIGFTKFFGPVPVNSNITGNFTQSDVDALDLAGINSFANTGGALCLYGLVSPVSKNADETFWQFQAGRERMQLVSLFSSIAPSFEFKNITFENLTLLDNRLTAAMQAEETAGALYKDDGNPGFVVSTDDPVNTATTAQNGQMLAKVGARLVKGADFVGFTLIITPLTQTIQV